MRVYYCNAGKYQSVLCIMLCNLSALCVCTITMLVSIKVCYVLCYAEHNRDILERVGFFDKCGKEWLFPSIQDAINHAQQGSKLVSIIIIFPAIKKKFFFDKASR